MKMDFGDYNLVVFDYNTYKIGYIFDKEVMEHLSSFIVRYEIYEHFDREITIYIVNFNGNKLSRYLLTSLSNFFYKTHVDKDIDNLCHFLATNYFGRYEVNIEYKLEKSEKTTVKFIINGVDYPFTSNGFVIGGLPDNTLPEVNDVLSGRVIDFVDPNNVTYRQFRYNRNIFAPISVKRIRQGYIDDTLIIHRDNINNIDDIAYKYNLYRLNNCPYILFVGLGLKEKKLLTRIKGYNVRIK